MMCIYGKYKVCDQCNPFQYVKFTCTSVHNLLLIYEVIYIHRVAIFGSSLLLNSHEDNVI